jgi:hypothetical protein
MSLLGMQLDLSEGIEAAVPGWADIRLLAPHAELRLLACGQGTLIDASRLRCWLEPAFSSHPLGHQFIDHLAAEPMHDTTLS